MKTIALALSFVVMSQSVYAANRSAESIGGCVPIYQQRIDKILDRKFNEETSPWYGGVPTAAGAFAFIMAKEGFGFLVFGLLGAGSIGFLGAGAGYLIWRATDRYGTYSHALDYIGLAAGESEAEMTEKYRNAGEWPGKYQYDQRFISELDTDFLRPLKRRGINVTYDQVREKILELNQEMEFCRLKGNGKYKLDNHRQMRRKVIAAFSSK